MKPITYVVGDVTRPFGDGQRVIAHVCNNYGGWARGVMLNLSQRCVIPEARYLDWYNLRDEVPYALNMNPFGLGAIQFAPLFYPPGTGNIFVCNMVARVQGETIDDQDWNYGPLHYDALQQCLIKLGNRLKDEYMTVHIPRIGNGADGGDWHQVKPFIEQELCAQDIEVRVYDLPKATSLETESHQPKLVPIEGDALRAARDVLPDRDDEITPMGPTGPMISF